MLMGRAGRRRGFGGTGKHVRPAPYLEVSEIMSISVHHTWLKGSNSNRAPLSQLIPNLAVLVINAGLMPNYRYMRN